MHIIVTGASSFVGSHLTRHFLKVGYEVTATCRTHNAAVSKLRAEFSGPNLRLVEIDLARATCFGTLPPGVEGVVHVAGVSAADGVTTAELLDCNVHGTHNLIRHALDTGVRKFVFTSSLSIHGEIKTPVVDENSLILNSSVYGASKYLAERMLAAVSKEMPSIAVRLPGVLGVGAHRAWLPALLEKMRSNRDVTIFNPDADFNNAAHVDDIGAFFADIMQRDWKGFTAFPVGASGMTSIRKAVETIRKGCGSVSKIIVDPAVRPGFVISSDRAIALGYRPMDIVAMIERYVAESKCEA
jgi:nucleoside-diphosphate-sugar epimerase